LTTVPGSVGPTPALPALRLTLLKARLSDVAYLALHLEGPGFQVDVTPSQAEQSSLPQTGPDVHPVPRPKAIVSSGGQQRLDLLRSECPAFQ
jgi:hypothetical protein